jgi:hypothetical protein
MWKKAVMACFNALSRYLPGWTEENHKNPHSGQLVARPIFEPEIS